MPSTSEKRSRIDPAARAKAGAKVKEGIEQRAQGDEFIVGWWTYLPWIAICVGLVGMTLFVLLIPGIGGWAFGYVVMYTLGFAFLAILDYRLTRRLRAHVSREAQIRAGLIEHLEALGRECGQGGLVLPEVTILRSLDGDANANEAVPNPLYAPMSALPIVGFAFEFFYLYHLNRVPSPHETRWVAFIQQYAAARSKSGHPESPAAIAVMKKRSFAAYALASFLLFPFLAYWHHLMIREMNEHFQAQWKTEDQLLAHLE